MNSHSGGNDAPWPSRPLGTLLEAVTDYRGKTPPKSDSGIPTLTAANIRNGRIDLSKVTFVSQETYIRWTTRGLPRAGDVLITTEAPVGQVASLPADRTYLITRRVIALRGKTGSLDNDFLKYSLLHPEHHERLLSKTRGSTVPRVLKPDILELEIPIPSITEQRAISGILSAFDNKIELNRKMNVTLDAIARAIFKSWFIDFDPVHAKAAGEQPYGMDANTAALFPDSFTASALGPIPAGWNVGSLIDTTEIVGGGTPKTSVPEYWDGDIPWFSVKDAPNESDVYVIATEKHITKAGLENSSARILPVDTTIVSARGTVGRLALVGSPMAMNQSCYGIRCARGYSSLFTHFQLRSTVSALRQRTHGTVFDTITRSTFETIPAVKPPARMAQEFEATVRPLLDLIRNNLQQSRTLTELRDTLLPRLISGRLRVPPTLRNQVSSKKPGF